MAPRSTTTFALGVGLAACACLALSRPPADAAPPPDPIRLRFATIAPEKTPWADQLLDIKRRIEKESGGRIKISMLLGGGPYPGEQEMVKDLRRGKLQAGAFSTGAIASLVPELQVLELPYLFKDTGEADYIIDQVLGEPLKRAFEREGLVLMIWGENGWRSIGTCGGAVRKPEDLKDLRVRAQEQPLHVAFWSAIGATAVEIPISETLGALETGVIAGFDQTPLFATAAGWHAKIKHFTLTRHIYQAGAVVYNKLFFDSLPADLQKVVVGDPEAEKKRSRAGVRAMTADLLVEFGATGIEVVDLAEAEREAFRRLAVPVQERFGKEIGGDLYKRAKEALEAYRAGKR
jgi:TRAP-type C4-dicarboxylate transport system substrate-binding protein